MDAVARRLLDRGAPALPAHKRDLGGVAMTIFFLAWGPLLLIGPLRVVLGARRTAAPEDASPPRRAPLDRFDVLLRPMSIAIALLLAERIGAWLDLPHFFWWVALVAAIVGFALLVSRVHLLPWWRSGVGGSIGRACFWGLEAGVLTLLLR